MQDGQHLSIKANNKMINGQSSSSLKLTMVTYGRESLFNQTNTESFDVSFSWNQRKNSEDTVSSFNVVEASYLTITIHRIFFHL